MEGLRLKAYGQRLSAKMHFVPSISLRGENALSHLVPSFSQIKALKTKYRISLINTRAVDWDASEVRNPFNSYSVRLYPRRYLNVAANTYIMGITCST